MAEKQNETICSHVARLLKSERVKQQLSLNVVAKRARVSRQMVSYIEQEERNPTLETLLRITTVLGLKIEDVISRARQAATASNKK